jgi:ribosomal protein S18 acetylase RimI-like enzyme
MTFRDIVLDDYENLISFWKENYFVGDMDGKERFQLFLEKNPNLSILAEEQGKIIGTALGSFDGRRGYLQKLTVDKTHRKQGLGQQLVEKIIEKLTDLGVTYIPIAVEEDLVHFYETCGFKKTTQVPMNMEIK